MSPQELAALVEAARLAENCQSLLDYIPYTRLIGMTSARVDGQWRFCLPANPDNVGNPTVPALHGGVIAGFMEQSALVHLLLVMDDPRFPEIVDFSIDYLRSGHLKDTYAQCQLWRQGRRVANLAITAWQSDSANPIATARVHFRMTAG